MWCLPAAPLRRGEREKKLKGTYSSSSVKNQLSLLVDKKKNAEFDNVDCSRLRDCLEVSYMCCKDAELQGSVTGSVAKIARCASTPTRKDRPPRARARAQVGSACRALRRWRGKFSRQRSNYSSSCFRRHTLDCAHTLCAFPTIWSWRGNFYRQRTHERTLPCPHFEGRTLDPHARAHTHAMSRNLQSWQGKKWKSTNELFLVLI
jgi:hypothetical protein